ncbi:hypothetical protein HMPREF0556_12441 [Listeria grayi DSM 20601]|uniref:Uncharacterized protein n=1 Tax=Listeria grayi DSM 20601 TaxID=525367 RepID=D7V003_LISGR|nr:hypothetical protein HMPREF0556_12441 [Listeria grayi DSM 20601]
MVIKNYYQVIKTTTNKFASFFVCKTKFTQKFELKDFLSTGPNRSIIKKRHVTIIQKAVYLKLKDLKEAI